MRHCRENGLPSTLCAPECHTPIDPSSVSLNRMRFCSAISGTLRSTGFGMSVRSYIPDRFPASTKQQAMAAQPKKMRGVRPHSGGEAP
jgi:hypothetical protein